MTNNPNINKTNPVQEAYRRASRKAFRTLEESFSRYTELKTRTIACEVTPELEGEDPAYLVTLRRPTMTEPGFHLSDILRATNWNDEEIPVDTWVPEFTVRFPKDGDATLSYLFVDNETDEETEREELLKPDYLEALPFVVQSMRT